MVVSVRFSETLVKSRSRDQTHAGVRIGGDSDSARPRGTVLLWILKSWGSRICPNKEMRRAAVRQKIDLQISLVILFQVGATGF